MPLPVDGRILPRMRLHDGAYGTLLARHQRGDETADDLSVRDPLVVTGAHAAYLDAGATAIQTNSFLVHLRGSSRRRAELRRAALDCAAAAAAAGAGDALVLATIGPAGDEPRHFWEAIEQFLDLDVRAVVCETVTSREMADAVLAAWADVAAGVNGIELLLGCSTDPSDGEAARWIVELAGEAPDLVQLGLNCCAGPGGMRSLLESIAERRGRTWAMPSAGLPTNPPGAPPAWPLADPASWAESTLEQVEGLPVTALGGCCGTTPDHVAALGPSS